MQQFLLKNLWHLSNVCVFCVHPNPGSQDEFLAPSAGVHGSLTLSPSSPPHLEAEPVVTIFRTFLSLQVEKPDVGRAVINPRVYPCQSQQGHSWLKNNIYEVFFSFQQLWQAMPDQTSCGRFSFMKMRWSHTS